MKLARPTSRQTRLLTTISETQQSEPLSKSTVSISLVRELHASLIRTQMHTDTFQVSGVIQSYASSPATLHKALFAFHQIERPTWLAWNVMIRELSQYDRPNDALQLYDKMRGQGFNGNDLTFIFVLKACGKASGVLHGRKIHVHALRLGFESYLYVSNALIHMYASCGDLFTARQVFDKLSERDLVSWNSLICGYCQGSRFKEVLQLFDAMREANVKADQVTMMKVILACSRLGDKEISDGMVKYIEDNRVEIDVYLGNTLVDMYGRRGSVGLARQVFDSMGERNIVSWNTLMTGYAKIGDLVSARKLFDEMPMRDVISWTSMITCYAQAKQFNDAVNLFQEMMRAEVKPDEITFASVLSACAHLGRLDVGKAVHDYIRKHNVKEDVYVGNSLIDMYCKCGSVLMALKVFEGMKEKDSISWTSVISGLAVNGNVDHALGLFSQMLKEGFRPNHGIFVGILLACTHAGLVDQGLDYFESMEKDHGLVPEMKHYGCVVDLLSRSGNLDRAYEFITNMTIDPDIVIWRMLLSACMLHENIIIAEIATNKLLELDPDNSGNYVLSSNTYAKAERWDDANKMRELMEGGRVQKPSDKQHNLSFKQMLFVQILNTPCRVVKHDFNGSTTASTGFKSFLNVLLVEAEPVCNEGLHIKLTSSQKLNAERPRVPISEYTNNVNFPVKVENRDSSDEVSVQNFVNRVHICGVPCSSRSQRDGHFALSQSHEAYFTTSTSGIQSCAHGFAKANTIKGHIYISTHSGIIVGSVTVALVVDDFFCPFTQRTNITPCFNLISEAHENWMGEAESKKDYQPGGGRLYG
ncbi:hypothetical protein RJ640_022951 [Escallonia rubra]|uniref:Pentatricopeptide repeat-containing protein n=1 Tax=Escallonia rubra TaxID=112253 RepID=A0AA88RF93_9ASTE|nr:hypothetical protein RJ640_022951 [Escallonia rubra]